MGGGAAVRHANPQDITHALFTVRSRSLLFPTDAQPSKLWAYLSGLLIGIEIAGAGVKPESTVHLIGDEGLSRRSVMDCLAWRAESFFFSFLSTG